MSGSNKADIFSALAKGDLDFLKGLPCDIDVNEYITIDTPADRYCLCHVEFELFRGSAEEMITTYGDAVASGKCAHCDGQPSAPQSHQEIQQLRSNFINSDYFEYLSDFYFGVAVIQTVGGLNALQIAIHFGQRAVAEWLINEKGASMHSITQHVRETPLNLAALHGNADMVKFLLENGAQINCYSKVMNITPAKYAARFNHPDVLEYLIKQGADINDDRGTNETPLCSAVYAGNLKCTEMLLKARAETKDSQNAILFRTAVEHGHREMANMFLDYINVSDKFVDDRGREDTPLLAAIRMDDSDMVKLLIEKGANTDTDIGGEHTVLYYAVFQNMFEITKLLVESGCSVNHVNNTKYSSLHFAAWEGYLQICELLLAHGAVYDTQTVDKNTPLALACHGDYLNVIKLLLPLGCNVNNQDKDKDTPLLYTTYNGNVEATLLLLEHGADPEMPNNLGTAPIWNTVYARCIELVQHFLELNVELDGTSVGILQHAQQIDVVKIYSSPKSLLYVACDRLLPTIPTWLVLAGLDISKETWVYNNDLPRSLTGEDQTPEIKAVYDELYHLTHHVCTLKQICRMYIRRLLKRRLCRDVGQLGLPRLLQGYLCCKVF